MPHCKLEIVTPEGIVFSGDADFVELPGVEGELGVYPQHIPVLTLIHPGELTYYIGSTPHYLAVGRGIVEITQERVAVLTDMALDADNIDEAEAQAAVERAQKALEQKVGDEEVALVRATLDKSLAQLKLKRRIRR